MAAALRRNRLQKRRQGTATVELALLLPLFLLLLFASMEVALIVADSVVLNHAARETARAASIGKTTSELRTLVNASLPESIHLTQEQISLQKRSQSEGSWGSWTTLGDSTQLGVTYNDAACGDQVQVLLTYQHRLITTSIISGASENGTITLRAATVMLRN